MVGLAASVILTSRADPAAVRVASIALAVLILRTVFSRRARQETQAESMSHAAAQSEAACCPPPPKQQIGAAIFVPCDVTAPGVLEAVAGSDSVVGRLHMHLKSTAQSYSSATKILHWLMAVLVVTCWMLGFLTDDVLKASSRTVTLFVHIAVGLALFDVLVLRALWRAMSSPPPAERRYLGYGPGWAD